MFNSSFTGVIALAVAAVLTGCVNLANSAARKNWAVLIAGSKGYFNYRHQADVAHSYQLLTTLGDFPPERVITMIYDDVVNSTENPFPGRLFNEPGGADVWGDIVVDYQGDDVTTENFLNVLKGIKSGGTKRGKVLESSCDDNVFVYYSDHGATGLVAMPSGEPLFADDLNKALEHMHRHCMYHELVFYLEACESGSMFQGILSNSTKIFATTAATGEQPSYAFYYNDTLSTYMADEYSIRWMQDSTAHWKDTQQETLQQQFQDVSSMVKESQPQQFGDLRFCNEPVEDFEASGFEKRSDILKLLRNSMNTLKEREVHWEYFEDWDPSAEAVSSRDVKLAVLQKRFLAATTIDEKWSAKERVEEELDHRMDVDLVFDELIKYVAGISHSKAVVTNIEANAFKYGHIPPTNWQCLKAAYSAYERHCERFTDYSLKYVNALSNLCEIFGDEQLIEDGLQMICGRD